VRSPVGAAPRLTAIQAGSSPEEASHRNLGQLGWPVSRGDGGRLFAVSRGNAVAWPSSTVGHGQRPGRSRPEAPALEMAPTSESSGQVGMEDFPRGQALQPRAGGGGIQPQPLTSRAITTTSLGSFAG